MAFIQGNSLATTKQAAYWDATKTHREGPLLYAYCAEPAHGAESDCKAYE